MIPPTPEASGEPLLSDALLTRLAEMAAEAAADHPDVFEWQATVAALRELQQRRARFPTNDPGQCWTCAKNIATPVRVCMDCAEMQRRAASLPAAQGAEPVCQHGVAEWCVYCELEARQAEVEHLQAAQGADVAAIVKAVARCLPAGCGKLGVLSDIEGVIRAALDARLSPPQAGEMCGHTSTTGGNDYLQCNVCGIEWDYRREPTPAPRPFARVPPPQGAPVTMPTLADRANLIAKAVAADDSCISAGQGAPEASVDLVQIAREAVQRVEDEAFSLTPDGYHDDVTYRIILAALQRVREGRS